MCKKVGDLMAQGLKPHRHEYYLLKSQHYYDDERGCMVRKDIYECMICGKLSNEYYSYRPPPKRDKTKTLEKNKKKLGNR